MFVSNVQPQLQIHVKCRNSRSKNMQRSYPTQPVGCENDDTHIENEDLVTDGD